MKTPCESRAWTQPPLFSPDWIVLELKLHVDASDDTMWGGLAVSDGDTGEVLMITGEAFQGGHHGLDVALRQLRTLASEHLRRGGPFPA